MDRSGFALAVFAATVMAACGSTGSAFAAGMHGHARGHSDMSSARHHPYHRHSGGFHTRGAQGTARSLGYSAGH